MHVRPYLTLLLPVLLLVAALGASAVAAQPAAAGPVTGTVTDQYQNPIEGVLVEALDPGTGVPIADASAKTDGTGFFDFNVDSTLTLTSFVVRVSDPAGVFTTTYYKDSETFAGAFVFECS
jgi:hypothetical protein